MDVHTTEIYNTGDLLALPNHTIIRGDDGKIYVWFKNSFLYGPHLLLVSSSGLATRINMPDLENNHKDYEPGEFTAIIIN